MNNDSEPQVTVTATETQSKKLKEPEHSQVVRTPPSTAGIIIRSPESKRKKSIASKKKPEASKGKGKGKDKVIPKKEKSSKKFKLVDEEIANYATQETANIINVLQKLVHELVKHVGYQPQPTNPDQPIVWTRIAVEPRSQFGQG
ncbi:hypothetical protein L1987_32923 [Smallanthus sonchifolius]|uniref:Uncharacterized protein n=1 Tax=Smallanthus sonchifolius TaxID=185202 RepID=A0ACB9HPC7_9ASTR|nr:hypothetical protein L1987_32923 [Smallanthus sonchifolius]